MLFLDQDEMLALLPAEPLREAEALDKLNPLFSRYGGNPDRIPALLKEGKLRSAQINLRGVPSVVVFYAVEHDRLIVDTMVALNRGRTKAEALEAIWEAIARIGRQFGCTMIEGVTSRAALVRIYQAHGFEPRGILMRKAI
jgi:hypothetical protein